MLILAHWRMYKACIMSFILVHVTWIFMWLYYMHLLLLYFIFLLKFVFPISHVCFYLLINIWRLMSHATPCSTIPSIFENITLSSMSATRAFLLALEIFSCYFILFCSFDLMCIIIILFYKLKCDDEIRKNLQCCYIYLYRNLLVCTLVVCDCNKWMVNKGYKISFTLDICPS